MHIPYSSSAYYYPSHFFIIHQFLLVPASFHHPYVVTILPFSISTRGPSAPHCLSPVIHALSFRRSHPYDLAILPLSIVNHLSSICWSLSLWHRCYPSSLIHHSYPFSHFFHCPSPICCPFPGPRSPSILMSVVLSIPHPYPSPILILMALPLSIISYASLLSFLMTLPLSIIHLLSIPRPVIIRVLSIILSIPHPYPWYRLAVIHHAYPYVLVVIPSSIV